MKTQIIGVLGLGIFGQTIATELSSFGQDVIALDNNATTIDFLADQVTKAAVGTLLTLNFYVLLVSILATQSLLQLENT